MLEAIDDTGNLTQEILDGIAEADAGEFATDDEVNLIFSKWTGD